VHIFHFLNPAKNNKKITKTTPTFDKQNTWAKMKDENKQKKT
jgi:hypothetical protein